MYKLKIENATIKTIFTWRNFKISKIQYQEGHVEKHEYANRRRVAIIINTFLGKKTVTMDWTSFWGKEKTKSFKLIGGIIIFW